MTDDLDRLLRWEVAGGTWQVLSRRPDAVTVALCRCDGGEEAERFTSSEPDLRTHLAQAERSGEAPADAGSDSSADAGRAGAHHDAAAARHELAD